MARYVNHKTRPTKASIEQARRRDTRVRVFRRGVDGVARCTTCGCRFGEKHATGCDPEQPDRASV